MACLGVGAIQLLSLVAQSSHPFDPGRDHFQFIYQTLSLVVPHSIWMASARPQEEIFGSFIFEACQDACTTASMQESLAMED